MKSWLAAFLLIFINVAGFTQNRKINVYITKEKKVLTQYQADSLWYKANQFVILKLIRENKDSSYYHLTHFDRAFVADRYEKEGSYCGNKKKKTLEEINKLPIYNEVVSIKLVSFKMETDNLHEREIPKKDDKVDLGKMYEAITLNKKLQHKVMDILINYNNDQSKYGGDIAMCYEPRNAIVFLNKSNQVIGFVEICFDCAQYRTEPSDLKVSSFCAEKLLALQGIFVGAGIKYGMKRNED